MRRAQEVLDAGYAGIDALVGPEARLVATAVVESHRNPRAAASHLLAAVGRIHGRFFEAPPPVVGRFVGVVAPGFPEGNAEWAAGPVQNQRLINPGPHVFVSRAQVFGDRCLITLEDFSVEMRLLGIPDDGVPPRWHLFQEDALRAWLDVHPTNPATRAPIEVDQVRRVQLVAAEDQP